MSDLLSQLHIGGSALGVHRAASAVANHNIENAATDGYARQRAELRNAAPGVRLGGSFVGRGVELGSITQQRDRFIEARIPGALAQAAVADGRAVGVPNLNTLNPDDPFGLPASLANFYTAVRNLSAAPAAAGARREAVAASEALAASLQRSAQDVEGARRGIDVRLQESVERTNVLSARVAKLNTEIASAGVAAAPNDLLDARQRAVDELVVLTGAQVLREPDGTVNLQRGSVSYVQGNKSAVLTLAPDGANNGLLAVSVIGVDGASERPLGDRSTGGQLAGFLQARDGDLGVVAGELDRFAFSFASTVNATHSAGVALDGSGGRDLFEVGVQDGAALRISVNRELVGNPSLFAAGTTSASGDNSNALALIQTERAVLASGSDPISTLANLIGDVGSIGQRIADEQQAHHLALDAIGSARAAVSGVSLDEELVELTKSARLFEAVSKVITTADEMLQNLLQIK